MSDILNIRVTQRELDLILDLLHEAGTRTDADGQPAIELCHDLMEQSGDVIGELEPTDIEDRPIVEVAKKLFSDAGIDPHGDDNATSKAADRRAERMMRGTASPVANDPVDW